MALRTYQAPQLFGSGQLDEPEVLALPITGTVNTGDFLDSVTNAGNYTACIDEQAVGTTGAHTGVAAIALHDGTAVYFNANSGQPLAKTGLFGSTQTGTSLLPNWDAQLVKGGLVHNNQGIEICLEDASFAYTLIGHTAGLSLIASQYFAGTAETNAIMVLSGSIDGPVTVFGGAGDQNKRVVVEVLPTCWNL